MNYEINDLHHSLIVNLTTNSTNTSNLILRVYKNELTIPNTTTYTYSDGKFTIPHSDFNLGDYIRKMEIVQTGSTKPWKTEEGVKVLLNGMETDTTIDANGQFKMTFKEHGQYDIQAVYLGNDKNQFATTEKKRFEVKQPATISGDPENNGKYNIKFVQNKTPTMTYNDNTKVEYILTKGGVPLNNKVVQIVNPNGNNGTTNTVKGYCNWVNNGWNAGTYKIGALFYNPSTNKVVTSTFRTITINKGTPVWSTNADSGGTTFYKGGKFKATLTFRNSPVANTKVDLYINGKKTTRTTSSTGVVAIGLRAKGTYAFKLVYKGDKNHNQVSVSKKITVVEQDD